MTLVLTLTWVKKLVLKLNCLDHTGTCQGCACFPEFVPNLSECHILWSLCSVVFLALTLKLSIQTSISVEPKLPVPWKMSKFKENKHTLVLNNSFNSPLMAYFHQRRHRRRWIPTPIIVLSRFFHWYGDGFQSPY